MAIKGVLKICLMFNNRLIQEIAFFVQNNMWRCGNVKKCETLNVIFPKTLQAFLKLDKSFEN